MSEYLFIQGVGMYWDVRSISSYLDSASWNILNIGLLEVHPSMEVLRSRNRNVNRLSLLMCIYSHFNSQKSEEKTAPTLTFSFIHFKMFLTI
jgi:hypothetical protein